GQFPSVVWLFESSPQAGALCTGTLIAPTVVLTAAHCIDPVENNRPGGISQVITEELVGFDHTTFTSSDGVGVSNIIEDPNHPDFGGTPVDLGHDDIALVILKTPKLDRLPVPVNLSAATMIGTNTTQVGYGIHDGTNQAGVEYFLTNKMVVACGSNGSDDN